MSNTEKRFNSSTAYGKSVSQNKRNTIWISVRQIGHLRCCCSSWSTQLGQKRWWPHGTNASRASRGAIKHTSQMSFCCWSTAGCARCAQSVQSETHFWNALSILFRLLHFPVPRFPPLQSGAAFSTPAFSTPAFLLLPRFPVPRFQRPLSKGTSLRGNTQHQIGPAVRPGRVTEKKVKDSQKSHKVVIFRLFGENPHCAD